MNITKNALQTISLPDKVKLYLPDQFIEKVKFLCGKISQVEWSGILFYEVEGSIKDPSNVNLICKDILLMNKGTKTYTEYEFDENVVDYQMENPELLVCKIGHIHSHNSMGTFFSGTDMDELQDNSPNHNFYLSLIVNNFMDTCAKVSFIGKTNVVGMKYQCKDENGNNYSLHGEDVTKSIMFTYDCDITLETPQLSIPDSFRERYLYIEEQSKKKHITTYTAHNINSSKTPIHPSWDDFQNSQAGITNIEGTSDTDMEELFACFILRGGKMVNNDNINKVISYINTSVFDIKLYTINILKSYVENYNTFFNNLNITTDSQDLFLDSLEDVIITVSEYSATSPKLKHIEYALEKLLSEYNKETIENG